MPESKSAFPKKPEKEDIHLWIESDGTLHGTRIRDQYNRELVCRSVSWRIEGGRKAEGYAIVTIELYDVPIKVPVVERIT